MRYLTLANAGGGNFGLGPIVALTELERRAGTNCAKIFNHTAGTSIGTITMAMLAIGIPASEVQKFFTQYAAGIFSASAWNIIGRLLHRRSARYPAAPLESALKKLLGNARLRDCQMNFVATTIDMKTGKNVYFQSYGVSYEDTDDIVIGPDADIYLWEVARASSAAQSYFPGYAWRNRVFWDGGFTGNNAPDGLLLAEAAQFATEESTYMLSLGTGRKPWAYSNVDMRNPSLLKVMSASIDLALSGAEASSVWQTARHLGDRHMRLNVNLGAGAQMDDASPDTLADTSKLWTDLIAGPSGDTLDRVVQLAI